MAISEMLGSGLFNEYRDDFIVQPLANGTASIGFSIRILTSSMFIARARARQANDKNVKFTEKMAMNMYYYGYLFALAPTVLIYPKLVARLKTVLNLIGNQTSMKIGIAKVMLSILNKVQNNFLILAILVPVIGLINILLLTLAEAMGKSVSELNEEKKKESWNLFNLVKVEEITKKFRFSMRILGNKLAQEFPMLAKFFRFIFKAIQSVVGAMVNIKQKLKASIDEKKKAETQGNMESLSMGKLLGGGFVIAIIIGLFKKTPMGGLVGMLIGVILMMAPNTLNFLKKLGPVYSIFIMFRSLGIGLLKRIGVYEFLVKSKEFISSLQVVQTLQSSFYNIK